MSTSTRTLLFRVLPLVALGLLLGLFYIGLDRDPRNLPSTLIDVPLPDFALEPIPDRGNALTRDALLGEVSLLNVFGSWCVSCRAEHEELVRLRSEEGIAIHGVDWNEKDPRDGADWLRRNGDPYVLAGQDPDSRLAIDLGVTGAPETYLIDPCGVVRYKHSGPLTKEVWDDILAPAVKTLKDAPCTARVPAQEDVP
ncbi:DsbE family thiol:disulfide interchange protein [Phaeovibrio sulfidiphilus]|uniref:DsbE family thiol:disulfide interchange protein n=1 Tax=Phaeovibrio sulfidiphilus TaxID=1220600 RepID=A0A8J6YML1_9PROT|nr:DsbE family thiol:disulfide interchange protein [Phaeovibrio sulfidiphilus]MBE1237360.1 DsbE family thiol:disulfide interchange protein [Phaeovibrio sulfidiphilus]